MAFVVRIIEAIGNAAFLTASFAIIAKEFPDNVSVTFASLETFFGLGLIVGPMVGGFLYTLGGYFLPFVSLGTMLFVTAVFVFCVLPRHNDNVQPEESSGKSRNFNDKENWEYIIMMNYIHLWLDLFIHSPWKSPNRQIYANICINFVLKKISFFAPKHISKQLNSRMIFLISKAQS